MKYVLLILVALLPGCVMADVSPSDIPMSAYEQSQVSQIAVGQIVQDRDK